MSISPTDIARSVKRSVKATEYVRGEKQNKEFNDLLKQCERICSRKGFEVEVFCYRLFKLAC